MKNSVHCRGLQKHDCVKFNFLKDENISKSELRNLYGLYVNRTYSEGHRSLNL